MKSKEIQLLTTLRHELHQNPEIAHQEKKTAKRISDFLNKHSKPDSLINQIGGNGMIATYKGQSNGKTLLFRSELDALPITESNKFNYKSKVKGKSHKCGHDGHMTIITALALLLKNRDFPGTVHLLYQPAEETGEGAICMLDDKKMQDIKVDQAFALHNLPGFELGEVIVKQGVFASASKGIIIKLKGKPSHASHPKAGINPSLAAAQIVQLFYELPQMQTSLDQVALITPVGVNLGQKAFGTSASEGELYATIRTFENDVMKKLCQKMEDRIKSLAKSHGLKCELSWTEEFQAVENQERAVKSVKQAADLLKMKSKEADSPFPWSEDFGQFAQQFPICLFGLGAGKSHPQLHNEDYDFPDDLIEKGASLFYKIISTQNQSKI